MNRIRHGRKNVVGKQKISSKYHQLVEKCNNLIFQLISIKWIVQRQLNSNISVCSKTDDLILLLTGFLMYLFILCRR